MNVCPVFSEPLNPLFCVSLFNIELLSFSGAVFGASCGEPSWSIEHDTATRAEHRVAGFSLCHQSAISSPFLLLKFCLRNRTRASATNSTIASTCEGVDFIPVVP